MAVGSKIGYPWTGRTQNDCFKSLVENIPQTRTGHHSLIIAFMVHRHQI